MYNIAEKVAHYVEEVENCFEDYMAAAAFAGSNDSKDALRLINKRDKKTKRERSRVCQRTRPSIRMHL